MKYSNTTIKELTAQYRAVLKKCAILNAAVLMGVFVAMPAVADDLTQRTAVSSAENITLTDPTAKNLTAARKMLEESILEAYERQLAMLEAEEADNAEE